MEQTGEYLVAAPRQRVWAALNDPEALKRCIDGCESLTVGDDGVMHAVVRAKVGPVSAAFAGDVTLSDVDPPNGYTLAVKAKAGPAGFARGTARVALADEGEATKLSYAAEGKVGGKLAQIGQRLIDAAARKTADDFFEAFAREVAPPTPAEPPAAEAAPPARPRAALGAPVRWGAAAAAAIVAALLVWSLMPR